MPFNVLLLPLLGGYIFITNWNRTRFTSKRYSGERLIFHAAIAGVLFLILAFLIARGIAHWTPALHTEWKQMVPFPWAGTSLLAFVLGAATWIPLNRLHSRDTEARRAIGEWNDYLEMLLLRATREVKQVSITIKSGKVYVGYITRNFDPAFERKYVTVLPMASGFRDPDTQELILTTDYARVYQQMILEDNAFLLRGADDFHIVIPVSEIQSANIFDPFAYQLFNATNGAEP